MVVHLAGGEVVELKMNKAGTLLGPITAQGLFNCPYRSTRGGGNAGLLYGMVGNQVSVAW